MPQIFRWPHAFVNIPRTKEFRGCLSQPSSAFFTESATDVSAR